MRFLILSMLCMLVQMRQLSAQDQRANDSLEGLLNKEQPDSTRLKMLGDLTWNYSFTDPQRAMKFGNEEVRMAEMTKDAANIAQAYSDLASVYARINSVDTSIQFYKKALEYRKKAGNKEKIAGALSNIGSMLTKKGAYEESLKMQLEALKFFEDSKNELYQSLTLGNIGSLYNEMKLLDKAYSYWQKAMMLAKKVGNASLVMSNLNNMMGWHYQRLEYDTAIKLGNEAMGIARETGNKVVLSQITTNLGSMHADKGSYDSALPLLIESLTLKNELGDRTGMASSGSVIGRVYLFKKDYVQAEKYLLAAIDNAKQANSLSWLENGYRSLYSVYEGMENYPKAFETLKIQRDLKDSLLKIENLESINEMETKYGVEKKERENKLLNSELERNKLAEQRKNLLYISLILVLAAVVLYIAMWYKRKRLTQELQFQEKLNEQQDMAGKAVLEAEERERRRIAGDLHDGLGQMLSAAKMNLSGISDTIKFTSEEDKQIFDKTMALVDETCKEARSISHSMMPNALLKTGLAAAVKEFLDKIASTKLKINLTTHGINERLDEKVETVLYRVIQESVNNVIKHSGANQLDIQLIKDETEISVTIEDNGKGFKPQTTGNNSGIGIKNMTNRVKFLKGELIVDSTPERGTFIHVSIPL